MRPLIALLFLLLAFPLSLPAAPAARAADGVVQGLDPHGDGFLAVRTGPGSQYRQIGSLYNGDHVSILDRQGQWLYVRHGGLEGWSHGRWIGTAPAAAPTVGGIFPGSSQRRLSAGDLSGLDCGGLWVARNEIYDRNGYCFKSSRGADYFNNSDCWTRSPTLNQTEEANVGLIKQTEARRGCR